jgi:hypothetical protein
MFGDIPRRAFLIGTAGAGLGISLGAAFGETAAPETTGKRFLHSIDCTQDYPPDTYFALGETHIVESTAGRYRETEPKPMGRFGYRFPIENPGRPHVAFVQFPDDKRRFMCIMDGSTYDLTTGVFTDWAQPVSGAMQEIHQVFWPRWKDCSIVFMTWGEGEPAAAARIDIYELDELPPLAVPESAADRRELGIQYEDPCGTGAAEGAMNREEWIDRVVTYARHSGQGLLIYPMAWYHGPQFPSDREPADGLDLVVARDRMAYLRWTTRPADWYAGLLERFAREGLEFQGALTLLRLGSLVRHMNTDLDAISAGADTYNNMLWNNQVQGSTGDWTPLYNVRNFNTLVEVLKDQPFVEPYAGSLPELAYGESPGLSSGMKPMFNPTHPAVQEAILGFVREIGERYGRFPAFKGISFNMFASAMPWFGSIRAGYDDYTVGLFATETGIVVPVDPTAPDRFGRRYDFLTSICKPAWVDWRCRKVRELFGRIRQALAESRPGLRVTLTLWDETFIPGVLGQISAGHQTDARKSNFELFREAGIDIARYGDEPGLEVDLAMGNSRDRGGHGPNPTGGANRPVEEACMFRDFDFLDQATLDAVNGLPRPGTFIFNCWVEAWGKHVWSLPEPGDPNAKALAVMDGKPAEGILRVNSEYPPDGFWWESQSRITPPFPSGVHFMEPYAHAVAELDACRITRGGLFLDKAHTTALQQFALAYRALPARKFEDVGPSSDPMAVRTLVHESQRFFYAVNREYYPVEAEIRFSGHPGTLRDLAADAQLDTSQSWPISLGAYELRSFVMAPDTTIESFKATLPAEVVRVITAESEDAFSTFERLRGGDKCVPGTDVLEERMRAALAEGRVAWLRRALSSYIVRKSRELAV